MSERRVTKKGTLCINTLLTSIKRLVCDAIHATTTLPEIPRLGVATTTSSPPPAVPATTYPITMTSQNQMNPVMEVPVSTMATNTPVPILEEASTSSSGLSAADFSFMEAFNLSQNNNTSNNTASSPMTADEMIESALRQTAPEETPIAVTFNNPLPPVAETPPAFASLDYNVKTPEVSIIPKITDPVQVFVPSEGK